jgi:hypothetical protein
MRVGSLRDAIFLLAHDEDGRLIIAEPAICAGLAGATLIDLLLGRRVAVVGGRLDVIDSAVTGDPEADAALAAIAADTEATGPRAWVSWLAAGAYQRAAETLERAGVIRRVTVRRLGLLPAVRCLPANVEDLVRLRSRLRYGVTSTQPPDPATAALCGLVRALRLHRALLLSMPSAELLDALAEKAMSGDPTAAQVVTAVESVVTAATYR